MERYIDIHIILFAIQLSIRIFNQSFPFLSVINPHATHAQNNVISQNHKCLDIFKKNVYRLTNVSKVYQSFRMQKCFVLYMQSLNEANKTKLFIQFFEILEETFSFFLKNLWGFMFKFFFDDYCFLMNCLSSGIYSRCSLN